MARLLPSRTRTRLGRSFVLPQRGRIKSNVCWCHSGFPAEHSIQRIAGLINQSLGPVRIRVEILECEVAAVVDSIECLEHGRPVGCAVEQRAECFGEELSPDKGRQADAR
mgnify:CR=1 FL=1